MFWKLQWSKGWQSFYFHDEIKANLITDYKLSKDKTSIPCLEGTALISRPIQCLQHLLLPQSDWQETTKFCELVNLSEWDPEDSEFLLVFFKETSSNIPWVRGAFIPVFFSQSRCRIHFFALWWQMLDFTLQYSDKRLEYSQYRLDLLKSRVFFSFSFSFSLIPVVTDFSGQICRNHHKFLKHELW